MSLMVSISGIRGVVGESLTPEVVVRYSAAFGEYCRRKGDHRPTVVLGRDGRSTGGTVADVATATLVAAGVDVLSLGVVPTPTVALAVERLGAAGGVIVTASHNPMQWNGLKFLASTGMFLDAGENEEFWRIAEGAGTGYASWERQGRVIRDDSWAGKHIEALLALPLLDPDAVRRRKFRVVADCINAAGGGIVPGLLRRLGCDVVEMNCDMSGVFARTPEPVPENLAAVAEAVRREKADLGVVVDPDVDRLVLITEKGEPYGEEYTVTSAVRFVLERERGSHPGRPQTVVVNLSTTRAVEDVARSLGAVTLRTPVGEINVAKRMKETGAVIGGEGSGGVILPALHLGRDAIAGIGLILQLLAESGTTLSGLKSTMPQYSIAKGKIDLGAASPDPVMERVRAAVGARGTVNSDDGLRFDFPDHWVHLRKSNTEPIIRVIAEAPDASRAGAVVTEYRTLIEGLL
jgi:phosphomannomutase